MYHSVSVSWQLCYIISLLNKLCLLLPLMYCLEFNVLSTLHCPPTDLIMGTHDGLICNELILLALGTSLIR